MKITINGIQHDVKVSANTLLVDLLRDQLHLTGTHIGCDTSQCGCCTVQMEGNTIKSCTILAMQAEDSQITTIEGLLTNGLHPVQEAFSQEHGLQCGFCTPGMIMSTVQLLKNNPNPTEDEIIEGLSGNICRCTGYVNIIAAVKSAAQKMRGE